MTIYGVSLFRATLKPTREQDVARKCATSLEDCGDDLLIDGAITIEEFMTKIGPEEAERMAAEYAKKTEADKQEVESWGFWGFDETDLTEMPVERKTDVRRE